MSPSAKLDLFQAGLYRKGEYNCYLNGETTVCEKAPVDGVFEALDLPDLEGKQLMNAFGKFITLIPCADRESFFRGDPAVQP